jgi:hypothetical protein
MQSCSSGPRTMVGFHVCRLREYAAICRFRDCVHDEEPGCAVREQSRPSSRAARSSVASPEARARLPGAEAGRAQWRTSGTE